MQRHPFAAASLQHSHFYLKDDLAQTMSEDAHKLPAIRRRILSWSGNFSNSSKGGSSSSERGGRQAESSHFCSSSGRMRNSSSGGKTTGGEASPRRANRDAHFLAPGFDRISLQFFPRKRISQRLHECGLLVVRCSPVTAFVPPSCLAVPSRTARHPPSPFDEAKFQFWYTNSRFF
jgi:hypothetical protein